MSKLTSKIKEEIDALLPPAIFFFIALHLVALVRRLMLEGTGITVGTSVSVTIAALVLAKAVLLADMLPFINRYPDKPIAYNVAWKTAIYVVVAVLVHYLERLIEFWRQAGGFVAGNEKLLAELVWAHFLGTQIFLWVLILMFCTMREFTRVIGPEEVRRMFIGPLRARPAP